MAFYDKIKNFFNGKKEESQSKDVNTNKVETVQVDNTHSDGTMSGIASFSEPQEYVPSPAVNKLFEDLNFNNSTSSSLVFADYCSKIKPLLSDEVLNDYMDNGNTIGYSVEKYGYGVESIVQKHLNENDEYSYKIFADAVKSNFNGYKFKDHIKCCMIDNIKDDVLQNIVDNNVSFYDVSRVPVLDNLKQIDKGFVSQVQVNSYNKYDMDDSNTFNIYNPININSKAIENGIKRTLDDFIDGINHHDDVKIKDSINEAYAIAYTVADVCNRWLDHKGMSLLEKEFKTNFSNKVESTYNNVRDDKLYEEAKEKVASDDKKLDEIKNLLYESVHLNNRQDFKDAFISYCQGHNDEFAKGLKLERPEQVKLLNEYNHIVNKIDLTYKYYKSLEKEQTQNKEADKLNKYDILRNKYGLSKKDNNQQDLGR